ncbi:MAG: SHOCT domain-containing protein [Anaerolineae bacterium]
MVRSRRDVATPQASGGRALEVLHDRYARGELTREEFEQIRRDIAG